MAHKTLISGTAYSVSGGRELIGGTGYGCKAGKTLIGGTAFDVPFGSKQCTIRIAGSSGGYASVTINGKKYTGSATVTVEKGTQIAMVAMSDSGTCKITVNGATVASGRPFSNAKYTMKASSDMRITLKYTLSGADAYGTITVTTT